jgi:putative transposase
LVTCCDPGPVVELRGLQSRRHPRAGAPNRQPTLEPGQFTSWAFTQRAKESGLLPSMGTIGDAYDNAVIESFWARMQTELLDRRRWTTRIELANAIFEYLEIFHNRQRRHSALGWRTPVEFEKLHATDVA